MNGKIDQYLMLLKAFNAHTNVYSKGAYDKLGFHVQDCVQIAGLVGEGNIRVADFGSGSGLPAIVVAICNPLNQVVAVESKAKKRRFLREVKERLNLGNFEVFEGDVQGFVAHEAPADVYMAKAFADKLVIEKYVKRHVKDGQGTIVIPVSLKQVDGFSKADKRYVQKIEDLTFGEFYYFVKSF